MPIDILMPALSPTMKEGTLAKWHVKAGDLVESGDILAEIETDKATMEFEAVDDGEISEILVAEGTSSIKVNTPIAVMASDDATSQSAPSVSKDDAVKNENADQAPVPVPAPAQAQTEQAPAGNRIFASPLAKRIAADRNIDLTTIKGSGPRGRIVKADVESASSSPQNATSNVKTEIAGQSPALTQANQNDVAGLYDGREFETVELDGMRRTIAQRLSEAKQTIPHFYLRREIELDPLLAFRADLNKTLEDRSIKLSINDFIIKASALALKSVPDCNVVWAGDRLLRFKAADVAVAVAIEGGLFTPVLRDADTKTLSALSLEMKDLAARAKSRKLSPADYTGGSFAISNLGMMGIENFDAVINPPHGSILAVGAGLKKPVVRDDAVGIATMMSVTLSVDHRAIDGALGAEFLASFKSLMENPMAMLA
jgi:pyruvate dehydrogenase E2 component (dihydrolipoamide acetyltransferase)